MPINQYDELLAQAAPPSTNPYDRLVADSVDRQQTSLRISMHAATKGPAPDQAAKQQQVAERLKVPVEMVERHPELFTAQDQLERTPYDEMLRQSPNLAEWLQQPNNAAVAHDDLENLGLLEWLVTAPQRAFHQGQAQVEFGQLRAKSLFGDLTADEHARLDELRGQMDAGGALGAAQSWFRKAVTGTASQIPVLYGATVQGLQRGIPAGVTAGTAAAIAGQLGPQAALPEELVTVPTMFAAGMTAGTLTGGAEFTFQMEAGLAYDEYLGVKDELGRSIDPRAAKAAAWATGAVNAGLEMVGLEKLGRSIPGVKQFEGLFARSAVKAALARPTVRAALATMMSEYGSTLTAETSVEVAQRAVTILSGELAKTATNVSSGTTLEHRGAGDIAQDLENEATGALQSFALMVAPGPLAGFTHEARQAREAQHNVTLFTALGDTVKASKLAQRLPEAAQAFVAQATKDGEIETVYAPVDTWTTYWQSKGVDPAEMATELTGDPEAYARAQRSGEDLAIPTSAYAVKLAPTEHNAFFANELRLGPEQMNAREAAEFSKEIEKVAGTKADSAAAGAAGPVREAIVTQLEAAGFDRSIAETYAAEYEQPFTALAQRVGMDPVALFNRYGLQIAREDLTLEQLGGPAAHEIPASTAPANETADQGRARRTAHTAALTAAIVRDAQQQDPGVDVETLTREVHDRLSMYQEGQHQAVDSGQDAGALLRAIAEHGGLTADARTELYRGELAHLAEFQDRGRGRGASRTWRGVSGVFSSSGLSPDAMVEALREQGFSHVTDINALLDEVEHALSTKQPSADASRLPGTADLPELGIQLGARWWPGASKVDANRTEGDLAGGDEGDTSFEFNQGERGSIRFGKNRQFRIDLLRNADLSTFLHETGHFYLEVLGDLSDELAAADAATLTPMQQQLRDDYTTLLQWLGAADRGAITEAQHEQFARGFEAYLFEGKAPSVELRSAFSRFRAWLKAIYRTLAKLNVALTPEVRGVFDRLHATDAAIAAAEQEAHITPLFTDATRAGMTELEFASYLDTVREASQRAQEELQARVLSELTREEQTWWQTERDTMRAAVEQEITQQPVYRALSVMRTGTLPDGTPFLEGEQPRPIKLSKDSLVAQFGKGILEQLPKPWLYAKNSGIAADTAAELFGFSSGDELVQAILASRPLRLVVDEETERRMLAKFGDVMHDGQLQEFARTVVEGQHRETVVRAELQALTKGMTRETIPSADIINHAARERIAATKIREIRPGVFLMASRRASQRAFDLLATGADRAGAVQAKLQELVNLALYRAARDAKEQIESERRVMQAYRSPAARARFGKAGGDHLEQIDALLDRFELAKVPQTEIERRVSLAEYVKRQEGEGLPIDIPQDLLNEARRINYQDVTVDEFHGVYEAVEHIAHIARLKRELLKNEKSRNFEEVRDRLVGSVLAHNDATKRPLEFRPSDDKWRKVADWFASHAKIGMLARALDAHEDGGEFWEQIIRPLNAAATLEQTEREKTAAALKALVEDAYPGRELAALNRKVFIAAIGDSLSKEARLAVALNWGNEGNRSRLLNDPTRHWNEAQIFAVLGTLDARDLRFVRGVWSLIDSYWPQIEAKQKRVTGLAPEKVEAAPFEVTTADGVTVQLPGGYYPLAYDGRLVARAGAFQDANEAELLKQANYVRATTRRGHTEARQDHVRLSVKLELGVLFAHVDQVIHDLTHHETLIDVSRLLGDHQVQAAILETKGDQVYAQFKTALKDIAIGSAGGRTILDAAASWMRTGTQISMMGWNLWTALQQPLGLFNGMERVGVPYVARGMGRWLRDAASMQSTAQWIYAVSPAMASRHKTATADLAELRTALTKPGGWFDLAVRRVTLDTVTQQDILDTFLWHIGQAQKIADIPTWLGGYEKAMEEGNDERRAIALADQGVLDSQGGGQIKDLSAVERGGPIARALMAFYSYGNTIYNRTYANIDRFKGTGSVGELLGGLSLLYLFPAIGTVALAHAVGKSDDDDWLGELAKELLATALNTMVLVREVGGAAQIALGMNPGARGYEGPAGLRPISTAYDVATQVNQGKADRGLAKAALEAAGILFRFPALQVQRTVDGFTALAEGRTRNPLVVFTGAPRRAAR